MRIIPAILEHSACYQEGETIQVQGIMLHSVGEPVITPKIYLDSWNQPTFDRACVHAFIDGLTGDVYQTLPWNHCAWHCGGKANNTHISVEMCEPDTVQYDTDFNVIVTDELLQSKSVILRTCQSAVELFAYLCNTYHLDPLEDGVIISHHEGHLRSLASDHQDPEHLWNLFCLSMDQFRKDVHSCMIKKAYFTTK